MRRASLGAVADGHGGWPVHRGAVAGHRRRAAAPGRPIDGRGAARHRRREPAAGGARRVQILERGGNAVDAAIAANAVMGLMEPTGNGLGGDLFASYYNAKTGKLHGLNASGWAPAGLTPRLLAGAGPEGDADRRGIYSVTVPGRRRRLGGAARAGSGRLRFPTLLAPAIYYAEEGFPVAEVTAGGWAGDRRSAGDAGPARARPSSSNGQAPRAGEIFSNPDLAGTLRRIAEHGRDGFYRGPIGRCDRRDPRRRTGGTMTAGGPGGVPARMGGADQDHLPRLDRLRDSAAGPGHRGADDAQPHGAVSARRVRLPQPARPARDDRGEEARLRRHAALRRRSALREGAGGRHARQAARDAPRARLIDRGARPRCRTTPVRASPAISQAQGGDTIYLTVVDREGNIVSLIQSNYRASDRASCRRGPASCCTIAARCSRSSRAGRTRSRPASGRCTRSSRRSWRRTVCGSASASWAAGTRRRRTRSSSSNIVDYGMTIQQALEAGRFTKATFDGCDVQVEELVPEADAQRAHGARARRARRAAAHRARSATARR